MSKFLHNETTHLFIKVDDITSVRMSQGAMLNGSQGWRIFVYFRPGEGHVVGNFSNEEDCKREYDAICELMTAKAPENYKTLVIQDKVKPNLLVVPNKKKDISLDIVPEYDD